MATKNLTIEAELFYDCKCGVIKGDGCGATLPGEVSAYLYKQAETVAGWLVDVYKIFDPFVCPYCKRLSEYLYVRYVDKYENWPGIEAQYARARQEKKCLP